MTTIGRLTLAQWLFATTAAACALWALVGLLDHSVQSPVPGLLGILVRLLCNGTAREAKRHCATGNQHPRPVHSKS